jgi:preprotein translocase subunit SecG
MFSFLIAIEVLISVVLILVILMQSSKGGGLAGTFGGGQVGMVFGVRRTADFLTKATQWLAIAFAAIALVVNIFFLPRVSGTSPESVIQKGGTQQQATTPQLPPPVEAPTSAPANP